MSFDKLRKYIKSRNKVDALAGILVLAAAIVLTIFMIYTIADLPNYLATTNTSTASVYDINVVISEYLLRLIPIAPILVLLLTSYLLFESHSLGLKIGILLSAIFFMLAILKINSEVSLFSGSLCILGSAIQLLQRRKGTKKDDPIVAEKVAKFGLSLAGIVCIVAVVGTFVYIGVRGIKYISWDFITGSPVGFRDIGRIIAGMNTGTLGGIRDPIIGTIMMVGLCELIAIPLGTGAAIYLSEYAPKNRFVETIRFFTETLSGAPSIIIGLLGAALFVNYLGWGISLLSGGVSLAFMILPWNIRVTEEAMKAVPQSYREGAFA